MRDATRELYGPRVYSLINSQTLSLPCCYLLPFILLCTLLLSTQLTCLQTTRPRGLTTLLSALGASCLLFCVQPLKTVVDWYSYWFDKPWFLNWGKYLPVLCCNYPFLFTENTTQITSIEGVLKISFYLGTANNVFSMEDTEIPCRDVDREGTPPKI